MTRTRPIDPRAPDPALVREAARVLREGGLVVLPTETVYGLAANPADPRAMAGIYAAKGREQGKPVALLVAAWADVETRAGPMRGVARRLAERWWPGPLTLVLDTPDGPAGFRMPDHAVALGVVRAFGAPVAATSANRSGEPDARTAPEAEAALGTAVSLVLDAGPVAGGVPSTVVRVMAGGWDVLREGAVTRKEIAAAVRGDG